MMLLLFIADWKRKLKFLPILLVVLPVLWLAVPQQYKARYETVDNLQADDSYQNRILSWEGGFHMFLHNPITGVGPDNYTVANGNKYWPGTGPKHWLNAHSLYFKLLGELGLVGVITYFGYLYQLFRENHRLTSLLKDQGVSRMLQKYPLHCQMCLCLLLFAGYSQHNTYRSQWFIFGAISAAVGRLQIEKTSSTVLAPASAKKGRPIGAWVPGAEAATADALSIQRF
jgi:O-antigen ligase